MTIDLSIEIKNQEYLSKAFLAYKIIENSKQNGVIDKKNQVYNLSKKPIIKVSLKRFGNSKEITDVIYFLSSSKASYINGSAFLIDGGLTTI